MTWGYIPTLNKPERQGVQRYDRKKRWTGILQTLLGDEYYVVEEGLNSRTTNIDYSAPEKAGRNGKQFLPICLCTHAPLDVVIVMLGINDLKNEFNHRTSKDIASGLDELLTIINQSTYGTDMKSAPKILLISSPIPTHEQGFPDNAFTNAIIRAKDFAKDFKQVADKHKAYFMDAASEIKPSDIDGIHFDDEAHKRLADMLYSEIKKIL
ncbi:unnamed protein product [Didymodactylos carnosus]|uniref:SGNH hydrolase-type esterase domain-containing protein n=1 Tax=Didymodactylos carnosus TaxID=1234261 RepID=A0A814HB73_9BILA|nr:unnamed protein product [Didymodactylos carnosus]CAF1092800.1 unnamed protein product [Didymodactylos carnosus]CAF3778620.1 unnamed protein product [Didymodactylos carnosus]CAF3854332.1 unnamed protein product [Didymodactylos carnosus]